MLRAWYGANTKNIAARLPPTLPHSKLANRYMEMNAITNAKANVSFAATMMSWVSW